MPMPNNNSYAIMKAKASGNMASKKYDEDRENQ